MRVLVLSRTPLLADGVAGALQERFGFQALPTHSTEEALEAASMFNFDVAVVDWERTDSEQETDAPGKTPDALFIGMRIHHLQPRCKVVFYREQIPEHHVGMGFCFECISVSDKYETLYDMIRRTEIQLAH
jgi:DNA-binding NarL/FixJ family response regulator